MVNVYKKLPIRLYEKIERALKTCGMNTGNCMAMIGEELTLSEHEVVESFLQWCEKNKQTFGRANYQEVYERYLRDAAI